MIRGEFWTVSAGVYALKPRPAFIVQDDAFQATDSVTVLPLTSNLVDAPPLRVRVGAGGLSGLIHESDIMIDKLTTVQRTSVATRVGRLPADQLAEVERAIMAFLGLAR